MTLISPTDPPIGEFHVVNAGETVGDGGPACQFFFFFRFLIQRSSFSTSRLLAREICWSEISLMAQTDRRVTRFRVTFHLHRVNWVEKEGDRVSFS